MENTYTVTLVACKNLDFAKDSHQANVRKSIKTVDVASLEEASSVCTKFIADRRLGSGNWKGGRVYNNQTGELVAKVSYNGRIWKVN